MRLPRLQASVSRLAAHEGGAAAVEFAMLLPFLVLLLAGGIDVTRLISQTMQVKAAAQAGADYAQAKGWRPTEIAAAVTGATTLSVTASPAPSVLSGCISGQAIVASTATRCSAGGAPGRFVTIQAQAPFKPLVPWPGVGLPRIIDAQAVVRLS